MSVTMSVTVSASRARAAPRGLVCKHARGWRLATANQQARRQRPSRSALRQTDDRSSRSPLSPTMTVDPSCPATPSGSGR